MKTAANRSHDGLGGATSSRDPGHDLSKVRAVSKKRCAFNDRPTGPMRAGQARHERTDQFVLHANQATPISLAEPDRRETRREPWVQSSARLMQSRCSCSR